MSVHKFFGNIDCAQCSSHKHYGVSSHKKMAAVEKYVVVLVDEVESELSLNQS